MSRVLVMGFAPLPFEDAIKNIAPANRTWQITQAILDEGHDVCLVAFRFVNAYADDSDQAEIDYPKLVYHNVEMSHLYDETYLRRQIDECQADCLIGITTEVCGQLASLTTNIPFWADLYGSALAESQVQSAVLQSNHHIPHVIDTEKQILRSADKLSVVSENQRYALIGELGLAGRLNHYTIGYPFVDVIPATSVSPVTIEEETLLRGKSIAFSSFMILFSGGYNNWTDIETMFQGVERAMMRNPDIVFISTGGQLTGHDEVTYIRFVNYVEKSVYRDRFHLLGWIQQSQVHQLLHECDVGLIADKDCYEAELGSRTRLLDWVSFGLVPIVNPITPIAKDLVKDGGAIGFSQGDSQSLTQTLLNLVANPSLLYDKQERLLFISAEKYTITTTTQPLIKWINSGCPTAGDKAVALDWIQQDYTPPHQRPWFSLIQPLWAKFIFQLSTSPLKVLVSPLRLLSHKIKQRRTSYDD